MGRIFCFLLFFITFTVVENKGSGHSGHAGHSGHISHGSTHFNHVGEHVQQRLSLLKNKFQNVITAIKEKAAGNEQTPQEVSAYLQRGAENGLFKIFKKTVSDLIGRLDKQKNDKNSSININNKNNTGGQAENCDKRNSNISSVL